jgi:hypothetical protein
MSDPYPAKPTWMVAQEHKAAMLARVGSRV